MAHEGSARTAEEAAAPLVRDVAGVRVGFLSATYGTNGIPVPRDQPWSVTRLDPPALLARAAEARHRDRVTALGQEYQHEPNAQQARWAEDLTRDGLIDLVVGHHAHVVQPVVPMHGVPVAFGLGNFLSAQSEPDRADGVILHAAFSQNADGGWDVLIDWTPTRVERGTDRVLLLDDPRTPRTRHPQSGPNGHMTWTGAP